MNDNLLVEFLEELKDIELVIAVYQTQLKHETSTLSRSELFRKIGKASDERSRINNEIKEIISFYCKILTMV